MSTTFPPRRESLFVPWTEVFGDLISSQPTSYGLTAAMATQYSTKRAAFYSAWQLCQAPATKSKGNVAQKDQLKQELVDEIRMLARIIQAFPGTTNPMRVELGLPERGLEPTPSPIPADAPSVTVKKAYGRQITLTIKDATGESRGKPRFTDGAQLFSFVGANPPSGNEGWKPEGIVTRSRVTVLFPESVPAGSKVWFTAAYFNTRGLTGPACTPVCSVIGYEGAEPLAA